MELEATTVNRINHRQTSKLGLLAVPGAIVSALPILACALCWPAYAALISSLGLGFLGSSTYLMPLSGALLAVALIALGLQIRSKGYGPFGLGLVSVATILPGKFLVGSNLMTYAGVAVLLVASVWSVAPRRSAASASCSTCTASAEGSHQAV
jgi:mercuric ion transport protein